MGHIPLADTTYLKRRRGKGRSGFRWYVRMVVPSDLQDLLGKKTVEHSLNTSDLKEAQRHKHAVVASILESFDRARLGEITSADIEHEAHTYLRERFTAIQKKADTLFETNTDQLDREFPSGGELALFELYQLLEDKDWPPNIERRALEIAKSYGTTLTEQRRQETCQALLHAEIEAMSRALAAYKGELISPVSVLNARALDPITGTVQLPRRLSRSKGAGLPINDAAAAYIADRNRKSSNAWTKQTLGQAETTLRLFSEYMNNSSIEAVTRSNVASFLATIAKLNPNYGRRISGKQLNLADLLKLFPASEGDGLSDKTLNRHVGIIAAMFEWAIRTGKYESNNPAKGHHHSQSEHEVVNGSVRRPFTTDELQKLFNGSLFTTAYQERARPHQHTHATALAWLLPIALYSGMRLDEACGLRAIDIGDDNSGKFFNVASYEGRRLKTAASHRRVPVHSELFLLGFGEYVAHVKQSGHEYLFPALKMGGPDKKRGWYLSKRFTTYRRSVGVTDSATVFHSLRNTVATALERAHIPENEAAQIIGHKKLTMSYGVYSGGLDLAALKQVVEAIKYPGLNLSSLYGPR